MNKLYSRGKEVFQLLQNISYSSNTHIYLIFIQVIYFDIKLTITKKTCQLISLKFKVNFFLLKTIYNFICLSNIFSVHAYLFYFIFTYHFFMLHTCTTMKYNKATISSSISPNDGISIYFTSQIFFNIVSFLVHELNSVENINHVDRPLQSEFHIKLLL